MTTVDYTDRKECLLLMFVLKIRHNNVKSIAYKFHGALQDTLLRYFYKYDLISSSPQPCGVGIIDRC